MSSLPSATGQEGTGDAGAASAAPGAAAPAAGGSDVVSAVITTEDCAELLECARYGETEDLVALLAAGVPPDTVDGGGSTALHRAAANGHVAVIEALAAAGARLLPNNAGSTPLHWAALNGQAAAAAALLTRWDSVARVLEKNALGRSALTEALHRGHAELARALLAHHSAAEVDVGPADARGPLNGEDDADEGSAGEETDEEIGDDDDDGLAQEDFSGAGSGAAGSARGGDDEMQG